MSSTRLIKLITGEEIICTVEDGVIGDTTVTISEALVVIPQGPQPGQGPNQMGFAFIPWASLAADGAYPIIKTDHIIYNVPPNEDIVRRHQELFGRIQIAPKGLVINKRN